MGTTRCGQLGQGRQAGKLQRRIGNSRELLRVCDLGCRPVVFRDVHWSKEVGETTSIHKLDLEDFKCVFAGSSTRQKQGHAVRVKKDHDRVTVERSERTHFAHEATGPFQEEVVCSHSLPISHSPGR